MGLRALGIAFAMLSAAGAEASTIAGCLLIVKVQEKFAQPLKMWMVKGRLVSVKNDDRGANDADCRELFKTVRQVKFPVSPDPQHKPAITMNVGQTMWLHFRDGCCVEGKSFANNYLPITRKEYLEKQNGIQ
jgi:hypothetical protein